MFWARRSYALSRSSLFSRSLLQTRSRVPMPKRKRSTAVATAANVEALVPPSLPPSGRVSRRKPATALLDPNINGDIVDAPEALRASPDAEDISESIHPDYARSEETLAPPGKKPRWTAAQKKAVKAAQIPDESKLSTVQRSAATKGKVALKAGAAEMTADPEAEDDADAEASPAEIKEALSRPPPVNSDYLPLPWKGRLGYACLCTYLRNSNPPVFQSRTTRIASILEHRHPLKDPSLPEHPTKNRPDKDKPSDVMLGQKYIEQLCLANCRDMVKMLRWNDRFNIKFLRLSSEAFPFASHAEYGYTLAPFASEALAEVGKVVAELGHRVTTHPGQFTQLASPRKQVIDASIRDLEYHAEMLTLLRLPPQQDRDAVMVLHMGGAFGDKAATLDRFRENYARLSPGIKQRLVLENDDMSWNVHDLLPICQELNIPLVLDFHHHNIIFDAAKIREGTEDITALFPEIRETWTRKGITQKMHYSEPTPAAVTPKQRRKHRPRVATLPPCPPDMDLMIEAKDKEQAVFELMRTFKLPGHESFSDILPHVREDDNKAAEKAAVAKAKGPPKSKKKAAMEPNGVEVDDETAPLWVPEEEVGMGGPLGRVYWPPGMEEWLRPMKRVVKKKDEQPATARTAAVSSNNVAADAASVKDEDEANGIADSPTEPKTAAVPKGQPRKAPAKAAGAGRRGRPAKQPTPEVSDDSVGDMDADDLDTEGSPAPAPRKGKANARRSSKRQTVKVDYDEGDD